MCNDTDICYIVADNSPGGVRVIVPHLVVSLSATVFIDLGCHFSQTGVRQRKSAVDPKQTEPANTVIKAAKFYS